MRVSLRGVLAACALGALGLAGCAGPSGGAHESSWLHGPFYTATLSETPAEHAQRVRMVQERDRRALAEDLDLLFMTDRPTRLTRWHDR